ncbi:MAG: 3-deoxy-7-phosphoheptulonate synthase [Candidatus Cryptobacteroides sp.]
MDFKRRLPIPKEVKELYPLSEKGAKRREYCIKSITDILSGRDDRLLVLVGPCSADREDAIMEYLHRLTGLAEEVKDRIFIVPRLYTSKPRSKGNAYKGMLHRPDLDSESDDIFKGLLAIRNIHQKALEETGFGCVDEMLYPDTYRFLSDLLCYVSIGARSSDNQQHKLIASGLDIPVGIKNAMNGDIKSLMQTIGTAQNSHTFIYRNWEVESQGNPFAHGILRGYVDNEGKSHSNVEPDSLIRICHLYEESDLQNPALIVDCNHSNSGKDYLKQIDIARSILDCRKKDSAAGNIVKGLMIESYLEDGNQCETGGVFGKSITDPCLGWDKTRALLLELAEK